MIHNLVWATSNNQLDGPDDISRVASNEDDARRLDGHVGAASDGDADIGGGQPTVAIAGHGDGRAAPTDGMHEHRSLMRHNPAWGRGSWNPSPRGYPGAPFPNSRYVST